MRRLSIKSKLLILLLGVSIISVLLVSVIAYRSAQRTIRERISSQLTSLKTSRAYEVESYITTLRNHVRGLSEDFTVTRAMQEFRSSFVSTELRQLTEEQFTELIAFYEEEFLPRLKIGLNTEPLTGAYIPASEAGRYLQYQYLANNPNPVGQKDELEAPTESSSYSAAHQTYHDTFRNIVELFNYYDMFLIDAESGDVVYSVFKEVDFGTNLYNGPYSGSGLAKVAQAVRDARQPGEVAIIDFSYYRPSYNAPAAFLAAPIYRNARLIGILAFQFPVDEINRIMTSGDDWREAGLGQTGETFLVAKDGLMRSVSRALIEDREAYLGSLAALGMNGRARDSVAAFDTTVLLQEVATPSVEAAFSGEAGTHVSENYREQPVLSSYAPLELDGLDWVILAEMGLEEAYAPLYAFQRVLLVSSVALALLITLLGMVLSTLFTRPISAFIRGAAHVAEGKSDSSSVASNDEFGDLSQSLNEMVEGLKEQTAREAAQNRRNETLLHSLLPPRVVKRLAQGETDIVERYSNVTVLHADLLGISDLSMRGSPEDAFNLLNELVTLFDEAAERHGVEKIKAVGGDYMAVCGVSVPRLDHTKRVVDFAEEMHRKLTFFNTQRGAELKLRMGVDSGTVVAGILGLRTFIYDIWGEPVDGALELSAKTEPGTILVSDEVHASVKDSAKDAFTETSTGAWSLRVAATRDAASESGEVSAAVSGLS